MSESTVSMSTNRQSEHTGHLITVRSQTFVIHQNHIVTTRTNRRHQIVNL